MSIQQQFSFLEEQVKLYTSLMQKENTNPDALIDLNDRIIQCAQKIIMVPKKRTAPNRMF